MESEVQHQRLTFDSFPYKGWLIGGFVRTYTTTRVTSCVTTTSHAPCHYTHYCAAPLMLPHPPIINAVHSFIIVQQHVWINHWDFSTQPFVGCQVKGTNIATKSDRNFVSFSKLLFCETCESKLTFWSCLWKVKTRDIEDLEDLGYPGRNGRAQNLNSTSCLLS